MRLNDWRRRARRSEDFYIDVSPCVEIRLDFKILILQLPLIIFSESDCTALSGKGENLSMVKNKRNTAGKEMEIFMTKCVKL